MQNCCPQHSEPLESYLDTVKQAGGRITPLVHAIIQIMWESEKAYPLQEFQNQLVQRMGYGGSLSTIYRMVHRLSTMGVLSSMQRQDGEVVYFVCKHQTGHHHHFLCTQCAKIQDAPICKGKEYQEFLLNRLGAHMTFHSLQFEGLCAECAKHHKNHAESKVHKD